MQLFPRIVGLALVFTSAASWAATLNPLAEATMLQPDKKLLLPLPAGEKPVSSHNPYDTDKSDCSLCHKNKDPKDPGPLLTNNIVAGCVECHDDFKKVLALKFKHKAMETQCTLCHNPHESRNRKLLIDDVEKLCLSCHEPMKKHITAAQVKHDAIEKDGKCLNCHNPHASDVEHLLTKLPFDLCIKCHGTNGVMDHQSKPLTNFKDLLDNNPEWHAPVAAKDCSACHNPHGSDNFRILNTDYPKAFYSGYDPKNYALCFECHDEDMVRDAETTTKTQFRNGSKNLHYVHVNKSTKGRTCRACHEIHAAPQRHQIRASVPYGSKGWLLQLNYTQTPYGGSCSKTCHSTRSYTNTVAKLEPVKLPAEAPKTTEAAKPAETKPAEAPKPAEPIAQPAPAPAATAPAKPVEKAAAKP